MKELVGKRFLAETKGYPPGLVELKLLEISDSEQYLNLEYISGHTKWVSLKDYENSFKFIEVLPEKSSRTKRGAARTSGKILGV
jgi:hypothetical protein